MNKITFVGNSRGRRRMLTIVMAFVLAFTALPLQAAGMREVSLDECFQLALRHNLGLKANRFRWQGSEAAVVGAEGAFDPHLFLEMPYGTSVSPSVSELEGAIIPEQESLDVSIGIRKRLTTGASYQLQHNYNRTETNSAYSLLSPAYGSDWTLSFSQPLARGRGRPVNTAAIEQAENASQISRLSLYQTAIDLLLEVEKSYLDLIYWRKDLEVRNYSLRLAKELLARGKEGQAIGKATPLEVLEARAEVAAREEAVIVARNQIRETEDRLRHVMGVVEVEEFSSAEVIPSEALRFQPFHPRLEECLAQAFQERPDYQNLKLELENNQVALVVSRNQLWPTIDLRASLAINGLGTSYADSWDDIESGDYYAWQVGISVSVPWGNREARSQHNQKAMARESLLTSLKELEQTIIIEVRSAARSVETDQKRIAATQEATRLAEQKLLAEQERFEHGLSTSYKLLECQEYLAQARTNELKAVIDYQKSLARLGWVQGITLKELGIELEQL